MDETTRIYTVAILEAAQRGKTTRQQLVGYTAAVTRNRINKPAFYQAMGFVTTRHLIDEARQLTARGAGYLSAFDV